MTLPPKTGQGDQCYYCGAPVQIGSEVRERRASWDHKEPRSRGGTDDPSNLVIVCEPCNQRKGDMTEIEFWDFLDDIYDEEFI